MKITDFITLLTLSAIWGSSFLFMRIASPELGPILLMAIRVTLACLVLLPICFYKKQAYLIINHWRPLLIIGLTSTAIPFCLFGYSMISLSAGHGAVLNATTPMFGVLIAYFWFNQTFKASTVLGLFLGLFGVYLLTLSRAADTTLEHHILLPTLSALFGTCCYAYSANYTKKYLSNIPPLVQATGSLFFASLVLIPLSVFFIPQQDVSANAQIAVILLSIICTSFAYLLFFHLINKIGAHKTLSVTYIIPIFGLLFGAIFLHEEINQQMVIGMITILFGVALITGAHQNIKNRLIKQC